MSGLTKKAAADLVAGVRRAHIAAAALEQRVHTGGLYAGFIGGLESVLVQFLRSQQRYDEAEALVVAMNADITEAEIAERLTAIDAGRRNYDQWAREQAQRGGVPS